MQHLYSALKSEDAETLKAMKGDTVVQVAE